MSRFVDPVRFDGGIQAARRNLVANPSFEVGVGGWYNNQRSALSRSTAWSAAGSACLAITASGAAGSNVVSFQSVPPTFSVEARVTPGKSYTVSCVTRAATVARTVDLKIWWFSASGAIVGGYPVNPAGPVVNSATVDTVLVSTQVAPAGAVYACAVVELERATDAGEVHFFDAFVVEEGASTRGFFDGDSAGYRWTGRPHLSVSERLLDFRDGALANISSLPAGLALSARRVNLLPNPSFETGVAGWSEPNGRATLTQSTSQSRVGPFVGSAMLQVTATFAADLTISAARGTAGIPITPGVAYTASAYVRAGNKEGPVAAGIHWFDSAGALLSTRTGTTVTTYNQDWVRVSLTAAAPAGAAYAAPTVWVQTPVAVNDIFYVDAFLMEQAGIVGTYFDGDTAGYRWTGTPHNSRSEGALDMNGQPLVDLPAPVNSGDAATKSYVDSTPRSKVDIYATAGTWTKPAGAVTVSVVCVGGGAGGGSGYRGAAGTDRTGGTGGGGGSVTRVDLPASALPTTVSVGVSTGGAGGAAVTTDSTAGNNGASGGASYFGTSPSTAYAQANGGYPGSGGIAATTLNAGNFITTGMFPGGIGAGSSNGIGGTANYTNASGAAGGGGGGINTANTAAAGGSGGYCASHPNGGVAAGGAVGANGGNGPSLWVGSGFPGAGGGGGGSSTTAAGGNGGSGGLYGGGGGGGGASANGFNSGAGGNGAPGIVIVTTYF